MDTAGAMLGPLVAFGVLLASPGQFDAVFAVSLCFAILGLAVLVLFVQNRPGAPPSQPCAAPGLGAALALLRLRALPEPRGRWARCWGSRRSATAFLYLGMQRRMDLDLTAFPLLFVGSAVSFMLLAVPFGRLADRFGRERVFLAGYALLLVVYTALLVPDLGTPPAGRLPRAAGRLLRRDGRRADGRRQLAAARAEPGAAASGCCSPP